MSEHIRNLIDGIGEQDYVASAAAFQDAINAKMTDALNDRRISIANSIYNNAEGSLDQDSSSEEE